ncbi:hypothetical protein QQ991_05160 [Weizmannia coagulans]|uniref:Ycf15 n=2 Tax=Heyndrickxia TaxID=2837504 RepID=A0ABV3NLY9_9BACI|nr:MULTISPECIES: hypothetical protein [Heyndrickxia]MBQ4912583.1 hypothetical protein [Heyndrickxia faecalis]MBT2195871.1 hypothetical protein [Heyndrickxia coagulans]MBT2238093.1 hypothetical protein [Heyndrickxia coagulans]MCR4446128.1 hypothetical protein [Heyndrickxia coagulans]MCU6435968.1 hypothetical protein [Heyndrickxia coagulans]
MGRILLEGIDEWKKWEDTLLLNFAVDSFPGVVIYLPRIGQETRKLNQKGIW